MFGLVNKKLEAYEFTRSEHSFSLPQVCFNNAQYVANAGRKTQQSQAYYDQGDDVLDDTALYEELSASEHNLRSSYHSRLPICRKNRRKRAKARYQPKSSCRNLLQDRYAWRYLRCGKRLEHAIQDYLRDLHRCQILRHYDRASILVYDHRNCKLVAIRQNDRASAASLIKPFVMLGVYQQAHQMGTRPHNFSRTLQRHVVRMMQISDNPSTNHLIRHLGNGNAAAGFRYLNRLMPNYGIRQTRFVELIPQGGRTYRNTTTARDLSILLYRIYNQSAVSHAYSRLMFNVMLGSRDNRGNAPYLRSHKVQAATKTGYTRRTNGVAGIIIGRSKKRPIAYNYAAIITRPLVNTDELQWRRISTSIIQRISEMTYRHYYLGYANQEVKRYGGKKARNYCAR
jgi:beta-lactamase class A